MVVTERRKSTIAVDEQADVRLLGIDAVDIGACLATPCA
jgi:hypothetical protein